MRYAVITRHRREFPLRLMCRVLEVAPSGYYAWRKRSPSLHAIADELLMARVRLVFAESGGTYGAVRTCEELRAQGVPTSKKRVARLQRTAGLVARAPKRRRVGTTDSRHAHPVAPNHLQQQFMVATANTVWAADITYLPTRTGWAYLAVVLDLASRRVVGWSVQETLLATLPLAALRMALVTRRPPPGLLHHSDRGSQYAGGAYQALLAAHGIVPSMSGTGNCYDNAVVESFFSTLEFEVLRQHTWATPGEAREDVGRYIERWYNPRRRHSTLGYRSPMEFEAQVLQAA
jgi:transposase InsO family protein